MDGKNVLDLLSETPQAVDAVVSVVEPLVDARNEVIGYPVEEVRLVDTSYRNRNQTMKSNKQVSEMVLVLLIGALIGVGLFSILDGRQAVGFAMLAIAGGLVPVTLQVRRSAAAAD